MAVSTIVYLEMREPPLADRSPLTATPPGVRVERRTPIEVADYLWLYNEVGRDYRWGDRNRLPAEQLAALLADPLVEVWVLSQGERTAGYVELDRRQSGQIEIAYFGLFQPFLGQGLGRFFLDWTVALAWSYAPQRLWLHTCDRDHPAALPNYCRAGFREYHREEREAPE